MPIDAYDRAILDILVRDNTKTHQQIADAVNLSSSAVRRRIGALNAGGVIVANVAVTSPDTLGLSFIVRVQIANDQPGVAQAFEQRMLEETCVSQCYAIAGDHDYILVVHATTPEAYHRWGEEVLVAMPDVRRYDSQLIWARRKFSMHVLPAS